MCEILVWLNRQEFEYDVYSLVRAFTRAARWMSGVWRNSQRKPSRFEGNRYF